MTSGKLLIIAGLAGSVLTTPVSAQQQTTREPPCAGRDHVVEQLRETFGERAIGSGVAANGVLFELYVGQKGTWTLVVTTADGASCLMGTGEHWAPLPDSDVFAAR